MFQNNGGQALVWEMQGTAVAAAGSVGPNPGPNWRVKATGDFNGDGHADIVWQKVNGDVVVWETNGFGVIGSADLGDPGQDWHVKATGDFNHDGRSDILWQNASGEVVIWAMNGGTVIGGGVVGNPGPGWHAIGSGDFTGDGRSDILWQNDNGQAVIWALNGSTVVATAAAGNPGPSWHAIGAGDYNGDGRADILWQNSSGEVVVWEMSGASVIAAGDLGNPGPAWHAQGLPLSWPPPSDFNGDGNSDILFQNVSGEGNIWAVNGAGVLAAASVGNPGPSWHAIGTGDFNGDGRADILWQNDSGAANLWPNFARKRGLEFELPSIGWTRFSPMLGRAFSKLCKKMRCSRSSCRRLKYSARTLS